MLIYDGDCRICTRCARWAIARLPAGTRVVAWQAIDDLGGLGLTQHDVETAAYWIETGGKPRRGYRAIARTLVAIGGLWRPVGWLMEVPPVSWLAAGVYWLVARYRHRLPGGTDACHLDTNTTRE